MEDEKEISVEETHVYGRNPYRKTISSFFQMKLMDDGWNTVRDQQMRRLMNLEISSVKPKRYGKNMVLFGIVQKNSKVKIIWEYTTII